MEICNRKKCGTRNKIKRKKNVYIRVHIEISKISKKINTYTFSKKITFNSVEIKHNEDDDY